MHYELYIDLYFFINFVMDYVLLLFVAKLLKYKVSKKRRIAGAVVGALLTCIITVIPIPYEMIKLLLSHGVVNVVMIKVGLKIGWNREFAKAYTLLYISSFLLGGILNAWRQYIRKRSLFFVVALISYVLASQIWEVLLHLLIQHQKLCFVKLEHQGRTLEICAMIDTGNCLHDPVTKKPVSVIGKNTAKELFGEKVTDNFRFISYQSVGKTDGIMPLREVERAYIDVKSGKQIEKLLVAICPEDLWKSTYEMILNPEVL